MRRPPSSTLFPSTPLFRSHEHRHRHDRRQDEPGVARGEIVDPERERRLTHLDALEQHPVEGEKHRDLRSEEHTSELQSQSNIVCRLLLEKKKKSSTYTR